MPKQDSQITTAQLIRSARDAAGLTQQSLANRLSVNVQTVSRWERGENEPDFAALHQIAAACEGLFEARITKS